MRLLIYGDIGGSGGYIRYCKGLLSSKSIPKDIETWFVCSKEFYEKLRPLVSEIQIITHPWINSKFKILRYLWHLWVYPNIVRKINPDVEFYPSGQIRVFLRKAITIATCHNLLLFDEKELERIVEKKEKNFFEIYKNNQVKSFQKSNAIIFLSNHSKRVVVSKVKSLPQSTVIAHGLDSVFLQSKKREYDFGSKINFLYVSPFYHYKHQFEVIKAIQLLRNSTGLNICIKLIGGGNSSYASQLRDYVINENLSEFVFLIENVNHDELVNEYKSADIFVFASSCETFGITILEAMGYRLPIACSDRTGLSDILKDAGVYFDPENPKNIAEAFEKLVTNIKLRGDIGEKAYEYASYYTWTRCATETIKYIKKIQASK
jgi:glycosyltransferase involved in cell wall biosynthesis